MTERGSREPSSFLRIGRVLRASGLKGELRLQLFRPRRRGAERPAQRDDTLYLVGRDETPARYALRAARWVSPTLVVVRLDGVGDRAAAEACQGAFVDLDAGALPAALTDEADALIGAPALELESEAPLGSVVAIEDNGAQAVLVIAGPRGEHAVPFVEPLARVRGAGEARAVLIHAIPGLLD